MKWLFRTLRSIWPWRSLYGEEETSVRPMLRKILSFSMWVTALLFVCLLLFFFKGRGFVISSVSIVIAAYFICGCILGFIFGIPKKLQNQPQIIKVDKDGKPIGESNPNSAGYTDNTSLEEISDWITKIVIGLSLVQFREIQKMIKDAAEHITVALKTAIDCSGKDCVCPVNFLSFSYALIIFYFAIGAIIGYLWTRVVFPQILKEKDNRLNDMNARKADKFDQIVRSVNLENQTTSTIPLNIIKTTPAVFQEKDLDISTGENILPGANASTSAITPTFIDIGDDAEIRNILTGKPAGLIKDDPQKGRWGGLPQSGNYRLNAEVTDYTLPGLYKVKLIVSTLNGSPMDGKIGFALHDSFMPDYKILQTKDSKEVFTEVISYEAFTVGAIFKPSNSADYIQLELDLNNLSNIPNGFRWS